MAKELPGVDVEKELAGLMEPGLVLHEGERYMSLVVPPVRPISVPPARTDLATAAAA